MTRREAIAEARRRFGPLAAVQFDRAAPGKMCKARWQIGDARRQWFKCRVGRLEDSRLLVAGQGDNWTEAFMAADRDYSTFIEAKRRAVQPSGFKAAKLNKSLRADQRQVTGKALEHGRYCIFADCGLGKTLDELEYAYHVASRGPVLILAPLCVANQTKEMGREFGYDVNVCREAADLRDGINITNYDRLAKFEGIIPKLAGIVLDESSILKSVDGKLRTFILGAFRRTPFRLACTATPAPNDHMELGNHAEFLGICTRAEMLATYFTHDGGDTSKWRLKGHAQKPFWEWVASWSATYRKPSELDPSYSDDGFELPELKMNTHILGYEGRSDGALFEMQDGGLSGYRKVKRGTLTERVQRVASFVDKSAWVVWCDLNDEGDALVEALPGSEQLRGADSIERKEEILWAFTSGQLKHLVTKYKISSFGLNWQHCHNTGFVGVTHSYEQTYQALKRFHRFGQKHRVNAHFVMADAEFNVWKNLMRKFTDHQTMMEAAACA